MVLQQKNGKLSFINSWKVEEVIGKVKINTENFPQPRKWYSMKLNLHIPLMLKLRSNGDFDQYSFGQVPKRLTEC